MTETQAFRARYRATISPYYNAWLHGGFVLAWGAAVLVFYASRLQAVQPWEWLAIPLAAVLFNWGEYTAHRQFGHHKHKQRLAALFYKRHTGDHHSFFVEGEMLPESARDWRVIFFPAWLIVIFSIATTLVWWALSWIDANIAALVAFTLLSGYLTYEIFHACEHLPDSNPLARLPWIRTMRRRHIRHHRRELMQTHNFNLTFPLMDILYGTLYREPEPGREFRSDSASGSGRVPEAGPVSRSLSEAEPEPEPEPGHIAGRGTGSGVAHKPDRGPR